MSLGAPFDSLISRCFVRGNLPSRSSSLGSVKEILLRNWSYITEAVPMCWSQKGDLWLWLVSSEPRANSPASYSIRAIYYSCVLQYWRISASWLLPSAHLVQLHVLFQASHCSRVLQYSRALVLKRIMGPSSTRNLNPSPWFANSHASYNIRALYCSCVL